MGRTEHEIPLLCSVVSVQAVDRSKVEVQIMGLQPPIVSDMCGRVGSNRGSPLFPDLSRPPIRNHVTGCATGRAHLGRGAIRRACPAFRSGRSLSGPARSHAKGDLSSCEATRESLGQLLGDGVQRNQERSKIAGDLLADVLDCMGRGKRGGLSRFRRCIRTRRRVSGGERRRRDLFGRSSLRVHGMPVDDVANCRCRAIE